MMKYLACDEFQFYGAVGRAARTIASQAERLGYEVDVNRANTGTAYVTLTHPALDDGETDLVIRVADHEANEARYKFHVNREPGQLTIFLFCA